MHETHLVQQRQAGTGHEAAVLRPGSGPALDVTPRCTPDSGLPSVPGLQQLVNTIPTTPASGTYHRGPAVKPQTVTATSPLCQLSPSRRPKLGPFPLSPLGSFWKPPLASVTAAFVAPLLHRAAPSFCRRPDSTSHTGSSEPCPGPFPPLGRSCSRAPLPPRWAHGHLVRDPSPDFTTHLLPCVQSLCCPGTVSEQDGL